jgi:hypothetical protein
MPGGSDRANRHRVGSEADALAATGYGDIRHYQEYFALVRQQGIAKGCPRYSLGALAMCWTKPQLR